MLKFAANISWLYAELPLAERFEAAARDGFKAVEMLSPYVLPKVELAAMLKVNGLAMVLINAPPGGDNAASIASAWASPRRGSACLPGCEAEYQSGVAIALDYAQALACPRVHVMAGIVPAGLAGDALRAIEPLYISNLTYAAAEAAKVGIDVLIEPINARDIPGFFLNRQAQAHDIVGQVGAPNLKVQMDLYHCQVAEGDVATKLRHYLPGGKVGHLQIAGVPGRNEPDAGELNYPYLFSVLEALGYDGWIGAEYKPVRGAQPGATAEGLGWFRAAGLQQATANAR
jgi:hydroxypyruvate isomerase